jgi:uncharacterized membrane protein
VGRVRGRFRGSLLEGAHALEEHSRRGGNLKAESARRLSSVDALRGIVMILMALDHVRDYVGVPGISPTNLAQTTVPLFLTRWITHICAPTFFLLTGTGAFLARGRKSTGELSRFLFVRGVWLIVLEVTVLRCLAYQFNFDYQVTMLIVIWALGWAMIVLSALVWLPTTVVLSIGVVMVVGHNLLDGIRSAHPLWVLLHSPGFVVNKPGFVVFAAYPLIPWVGVTAIGYALGEVLRWPVERRKPFLLWGGAALTIAFVLLRAINVYGDPIRWASQASASMTVVSFLNATKYPPSLLFLLMTLGPALLILRALDTGTPRLLRPALTFGRVPLFYFILHFTLIHLLAVLLCYVQYGAVHWMFESPNLGAYPVTFPPGWGLPLPAVYAVWMLIVVVTYPLCAWFASVKQRRTDPWLSYF